ncbi:hypothetical protein B0H12DRAFT_1253840, partial [Mycena haematopus]
MADLGSTLPDMVALEHVHNLLYRGTMGQVCRTLVAIYQWLVHLGPSLAEQLCSVHQREGSESLKAKFPEQASAVEHIITFVRTHQAWQQQQVLAKAAKKAASGRGRRKKRKIGERSEATAGAEDAVNLAPVPGHATEEASRPAPRPSSEVPGNLWGLLPTAKVNSKIKLRQLPPNITLKTDDDVYKVVSQSLCSLWDEHLILRPIRDID